MVTVGIVVFCAANIAVFLYSFYSFCAWRRRKLFFQGNVRAANDRKYFIALLEEHIHRRKPFIFILIHVAYKELTFSLNAEDTDFVTSEIESRVRRIHERYYATDAFFEHFGKLRIEDYGLVLPPDLDKAKAVAFDALRLIRTPISVGSYEVTLTCYAGIVEVTGFSSLQTLMTNADMALMHASREEEGGYRVYTDELTSKFRSRMELLSNIRNGIARGEFEPFFQPRVEAATGKPLGAEALCRWRHNGELVSPGVFIPVAEESDLIVQLGNSVLNRACHIGAKFCELFGENAPHLSVNVSQKQLSENFPAIVAGFLQDSGFPAAKLELELTESALIRVEHTLPILQAIRDMGVKIALDDFGTGYSALSYLDKFRSVLYALKVDMSFTRRVHDPKEPSDNLVRNIFAIAKTSGLHTVVEGVETAEQRDFMVGLEAGEIQGYFFGKPMSKEDFAAWYAARLGGEA